MIEPSPDSATTLGVLASFATLVIAIGNAIFLAGRKGVSRQDLREALAEQKAEHDREFLTYKAEAADRFLEHQKHEAELRHSDKNHLDTILGPLREATDEHRIGCDKERHEMSRQIARIEERMKPRGQT
jgi:hypothetical protein